MPHELNYPFIWSHVAIENEGVCLQSNYRMLNFSWKCKKNGNNYFFGNMISQICRLNFNRITSSIVYFETSKYYNFCDFNNF